MLNRFRLNPFIPPDPVKNALDLLDESACQELDD